MSHEDKLYSVRLVVRDASGTSERVLEAPSCADLAGAAAVHLALMLRGEGQESGGASDVPAAEPTTSPSDGVTAEAARKNAADAERSHTANEQSQISERTRDERKQADVPRRSVSRNQAPEPGSTESARAWHVGMALPLLVVNVGPLPKLGLGFGAAATLATRRLEFTLAGEFDAKQKLVPAFAPAYAAVVERQAARASTCYALRASPLEFAPCASLWLEHLRVRGEGPDVTQETAHVWWASPGAEALVRWHILRPLSFLGEIGVRLEGARPRVSIAGLGDVAELGAASLTAAVATEWIF